MGIRCFRLPILKFSRRKIIGSAGSYHKLGRRIGVLFVATDFPPLFVFMILLHEFGHYLLEMLPFRFELKYSLTMKMEFLSEIPLRWLSRKDFERVKNIDGKVLVGCFRNWCRFLPVHLNFLI